MDVPRGAYVVSSSLKGIRKAGTVRRAVTGERPLERLFTTVALPRPGPPGRAVDQGHPPDRARGVRRGGQVRAGPRPQRHRPPGAQDPQGAGVLRPRPPVALTAVRSPG